MSINLNNVNNYIQAFAKSIDHDQVGHYVGPLKIGVDLGTANIVISVLEQSGRPIVGALTPASVVKDGLVVDYVEAVKIVKKLKLKLENILGVSLTQAATAIPPGTSKGNSKAIANVIESANMDVTNIVDEPTAAASVLGLKDGAVVDVGGGTTGISILKDGEVIYSADEPTGGTHMSLVLAGHYKISFEEAEIVKKDVLKQEEVYPILKPVVEKMASIIKRHVRGFDIQKIYVVGGASCFDEFQTTFQTEVGIETVKPAYPLLITPLGIALNSKTEVIMK
ncbi:ethanolamine utilization protein EutJ [Salipaludibacillus daqingensis]|uniref:ethanolamine utilization protein EutJ n=1 Tax=Salipaludibacillus daqingensis TaxID=3041001 RepID=UPI00247362E2|nr:ethanolamine utilization protein EutJ [Salipaludibacillus daqingensis]